MATLKVSDFCPGEMLSTYEVPQEQFVVIEGELARMLVDRFAETNPQDRAVLVRVRIGAEVEAVRVSTPEGATSLWLQNRVEYSDARAANEAAEEEE